MKFATIAFIVVALAVTACGAAQQAPSSSVRTPASLSADATPEPPSDRPSPAATPGQSPTPAPTASPASSILEGTWTTATMTCKQQNATLAEAGLTAEDFKVATWDPKSCTFGGQPAERGYTLRFAGDRMLIFNAETLGWRGRVHDLDADSFQATEDGSQETFTIGYTIDGDQLSTTLGAIDFPTGMSASDQMLDRVVGTVIFQTLPFVREATGAATPFTSTMYPYALTLPAGWKVLPATSDEELFAGPHQVVMLKVGSGHPDPGQTVEDRVALLRASQFADCRTDPSQDREITMGGERGILWSAVCGLTYHLAANTIHAGTGYRLEVSGGAEVEDVADNAMNELLGSFRFTD